MRSHIQLADACYRLSDEERKYGEFVVCPLDASAGIGCHGTLAETFVRA